LQEETNTICYFPTSVFIRVHLWLIKFIILGPDRVAHFAAYAMAHQGLAI